MDWLEEASAIDFFLRQICGPRFDEEREKKGKVLMDGLLACLVAGFVVGELQEVLDGPPGRRHLLRLRGLTGRRLSGPGGSRGL